MSAGIDIPINALMTRFNSNLFTGNNCDWFGRIFRNTKTDRVVPERYISGTDYADVLLNDKKDLTCFVDVQPNESYDFMYTSEVWVCFSVNLLKLYPTITTERATEYIHASVIREIKRVSGWKVTGLVRGIAAFSEYSLVKPSDDLHPRYLFRINCEIKYNLNC